jgi:hypothetical protein
MKGRTATLCHLSLFRRPLKGFSDRAKERAGWTRRVAVYGDVWVLRIDCDSASSVSWYFSRGMWSSTAGGVSGTRIVAGERERGTVAGEASTRGATGSSLDEIWLPVSLFLLAAASPTDLSPCFSASGADTAVSADGCTVVGCEAACNISRTAESWRMMAGLGFDSLATRGIGARSQKVSGTKKKTRRPQRAKTIATILHT